MADVEWWTTTGAQEEAYYLEHWERNEYRYQQWCRENYLDPEDVGSAVAFEDYVAAANNEAAR